MNCPNEEDWDEPKHLIQYIWRTRFIPLIIMKMGPSPSILIVLKLFIMILRDRMDYITFGTGVILNKSGKLG